MPYRSINLAGEYPKADVVRRVTRCTDCKAPAIYDLSIRRNEWQAPDDWIPLCATHTAAALRRLHPEKEKT
jgi:hypothetical protein